MHKYLHHIGDFMRDTSHLSILLGFTRQNFLFGFLKRLNNSINMNNIYSNVCLRKLTLFLIIVTILFRNDDKWLAFSGIHINGVLFSNKGHFFNPINSLMNQSTVFAFNFQSNGSA